MAAVIRVLLVDDDALVRAGIRLMLFSASGIEVVGEAADGTEVLGALDRHHPDVITSVASHATRARATRPTRHGPEEIVAVMRHAGEDLHGDRVRALIVMLWRARLRIQEAPSLTELDLAPRRGSVLVRRSRQRRTRPPALSSGA